MRETYWIGEQINTSGVYEPIEEGSELSKRLSDGYYVPYLYKHMTRFGDFIYISDPHTIGSIDEYIKDEDFGGLTIFLYKQAINIMGMINFLHSIELQRCVDRDESYKEGRERAKSTIRNALGL